MTFERDAYQVLQVSRYAPWAELRTAYRTLARRYHPDGSTPDRHRMVEINAAYERLEKAHRHGEGGSPGVPVGPGRWSGGVAAAPAPAVPTYGPLARRVRAAQHVETPILDFGQYAGWRLADIAECDPRYLRWLSRHSSGVRFRAVIERLLGSDPEIGRHGALVR